MQDNTMKLSDGRNLGFSDYGNKDDIPIFLFHGTPGSRIVDFENASILNDFKIRIIAPERPGYGFSDPKSEGNILDWSNDIKELADFLEIDKFHVAGESGGGAYTLGCALQMPTRILSATLIGSTCPPEIIKSAKGMFIGNKIGFFLAKHLPVVLKWTSANFGNAINKYPEKVIEKMKMQLCNWDKNVIEKKGKAGEDSFILHFKEAYRQGGKGHLKDSLLLAHPWGFDWKELKLPVFMWHGESDNLMPIGPAKEFSNQIPDCQFNFLPEVGHLLLEDDEILNKIINKILSIRA